MCCYGDKNEEILRKPDWLKIKLNTNENYTGLKKMMREKILILYVKKLNVLIYMNVGVRRSDIYDFRCRMYKSLSFCAVKTGLPNELDLNEPERVAESVELMNLKHGCCVMLRDAFKCLCWLRQYVKLEKEIHLQRLKFYHQIWAGTMMR